MNNQRIGEVARAAFAGLHATDLRDGDYLIPVLIQLRPEDRVSAQQIGNLYVESLKGKRCP